VSELKLLVVSESLGRGGAEQALVNLLPALRQHGCNCEVAVLHQPYLLAQELEAAGIKVHRLDLTHRWVIPQGVRRLLRVLRDGEYDVVHGHLFFAGLYVALTRPFLPGVHRVVTFHNLGYDSYPAHSAWRRLRKRLDGWLMRTWIDRRVAVSHAVAAHYQSHLGLPAVDVIPNAFPMHHLQPDPRLDRTQILEECGLSGDDFVTLLCGRLVSEKGHRYFIEAIDILRRRGKAPKGLIVGDGPLAGEIAADIHARGLQDQIRLHPAVTHSKLLQIMQAADLVVMASTHEGFPLSPGEAMALGRPVLATRVGGSPDLLEDGVSGVLVPPADPAALADGMARLMNDPERRQRLGAAASQRIAERFSTGHLADVWMKYYRQAAQPGLSLENAREAHR
jgi:glycosyltransferase involved in cell wall biosynthesis